VVTLLLYNACVEKAIDDYFGSDGDIAGVASRMINVRVVVLYIGHTILLNGVAFSSFYFAFKGSAFALPNSFILCFFLFAALGLALYIDAGRFLYGSLSAEAEQTDVLRENYLHIVGVVASVIVMLSVMVCFVGRLFQSVVENSDEPNPRKIAPVAKLMSKLTVLTFLSVVSQVCFWCVSLSAVRSIYWFAVLFANITMNALYVALRLKKYSCTMACGDAFLTLAVRQIQRRNDEAAKLKAIAAAAASANEANDADVTIVYEEPDEKKEEDCVRSPDLQTVYTTSVTESPANEK